jgi:hypothetical protein
MPFLVMGIVERRSLGFLSPALGSRSQAAPASVSGTSRTFPDFPPGAPVLGHHCFRVGIQYLSGLVDPFLFWSGDLAPQAAIASFAPKMQHLTK